MPQYNKLIKRPHLFHLLGQHSTEYLHFSRQTFILELKQHEAMLEGDFVSCLRNLTTVFHSGKIPISM